MSDTATISDSVSAYNQCSVAADGKHEPVFARVGPHVGEFCKRCLSNIGSVGLWVSKAELRRRGVSPHGLPTFDEMRGQGSLFTTEGA